MPGDLLQFPIDRVRKPRIKWNAKEKVDVAAKTNWLCVWCWRRTELNDGHIDHLWSWSRHTGKWVDEIDNLWWSCSKCNTEKGCKDPHEFFIWRRDRMQKEADASVSPLQRLYWQFRMCLNKASLGVTLLKRDAAFMRSIDDEWNWCHAMFLVRNPGFIEPPLQRKDLPDYVESTWLCVIQERMEAT